LAFFGERRLGGGKLGKKFAFGILEGGAVGLNEGGEVMRKILVERGKVVFEARKLGGAIAG